MSPTVTIHHNLAAPRFVWLWMKYVTGANDARHCTNVLRGQYSKKLSKHNADLTPGVPAVCDEQVRVLSPRSMSVGWRSRAIDER